MRLKNKLALDYTLVFVFLLGFTFMLIFYFSKKNRQDEFHQRFEEKTLASFKLFVEINLQDDQILDRMDKSLVNNLRQNTYLFDSNHNLIYSSSINTLKPAYADQILSNIDTSENEIFSPYNSGELLGIRFRVKGSVYFGIAQADDKVGKETMRFLALLLLTSFLISVAILIALSLYLARSITFPISKLTREIEGISPGKLSLRVYDKSPIDEVSFLGRKFNEMIDKVDNTFKFQHQFINHLSHELKTPLAVMMANVEAALLESTFDSLKSSLLFQRTAVSELSNIINTLLDISRKENELAPDFVDNIRIDDLLFECIDEMALINADALFDFKMHENIKQTERLTLKGNSRMLKIAFTNLLKNAINYSNNQSANIEISVEQNFMDVRIINDGTVMQAYEVPHLFKHLYRGTNSKQVKGFGLGLLLTYRIVALHKGSIDYSITADGNNCFHVRLPEIIDF